MLYCPSSTSWAMSSCHEYFMGVTEALTELRDVHFDSESPPHENSLWNYTDYMVFTHWIYSCLYLVC